MGKWQDMLSSIVFAINTCLHSSLGYSPYETIFAQIPQFLLSHCGHQLQLELLPADMTSYVKNHAKKLEVIRETVRENATQSQEKMLARANAKLHPLNTQPGDYVYLDSTPTGEGHKLQPQWAGPFIIAKLASPGMVLLKKPSTGRCEKQSVHVNRLKLAYVREPNRSPYFLDRLTTRQDKQVPDLTTDHANDAGNQCSDDIETVSDHQPIRRPTRL